MFEDFERPQMKRIYVDFNTMQTDDCERVYINTTVTPGLAGLLMPGMAVTLYDECLEVGAVLEFEPAGKMWNGAPEMWFGVPDWSTMKHL
jgi:hypothetical protein